MPCTVKKTFHAARDSGTELIAQVKGNQPILLDEVRTLCETATPQDRVETKDRHRGRQEIRTVEVFALPKNAVNPDWQGLLSTVIRVHRERTDRSSRTGLWSSRDDEVAYYVLLCYVSSTPVTAAVAALRGHWEIENRSHHVRDVTMAEDASRIRKNPGIIARIRFFASNILRANGAQNIRDTRYRLAIGGFDAILECRFMER